MMTKEEKYRNLLEEINKSLYVGEDLKDNDVLNWYMGVVRVIKEEITKVLNEN